MTNPEAGGLFCQGNRVPLKGVSIDVKAAGSAAQVCISQRYKNTEKVPVEAVYSFPLQESSAVSAFEVEIGGKKIVSIVEEREKAFEKYDEAMSQGHGAFLVDQDRPNIFTASVGNLLPDQEAVVRLSYATELEQTGDTIRLLIPTTISPRYISRDELKKMDPAELDHINPPAVLGGVSYGLTLNVEMELGSDVREVSCPSHPASTSINGTTVRVELAGSDVQLDQDFVLNVRLAKPHEASAIVARDGDGARAVMVNLFPDLKDFKRGPCEFVFIIDRSGSMDGDSITRARSALMLALRSLEEGDRFNVIGFGSSYQAMFPESVAYSQRTLDDATKKVEAIKADMGGTELMAPLKFVLEGKTSNEIPRQAILLTDGEVSNEAACIELAREHGSQCRIFTFGIGRGVSEYLVKGLARASGGQAEFIHDNERIEPKVLRQFSRMASAFLKNVRVDWGNLKTDLFAPASAPQLFDGDKITLFARIIGGTGTEVAVLADGPDGVLRFPAPIDLERAVENRAVPVLMARRAIQEIEERGEVLGSAQANRKTKSSNARVLELAMRYQIMSSQTSFVAVEERAAGSQTQAAQLRRIPVALTSGWGGGKEAQGVPPSGAFAAVMCAAPASPPRRPSTRMARARNVVGAPPPVKSAPAGGGGVFSKLKDVFFGGDQDDSRSVDASRMPPTSGFADAESAAPSDAPDELLDLAKAQQADGGFELSDALLKITHLTDAKATEAAKDLGGDEKLALRIIATLAALKTLNEKFSDRRDEWRMMADKAQRWIKKQNVAVPKGSADLKSWSDLTFS